MKINKTRLLMLATGVAIAAALLSCDSPAKRSAAPIEARRLDSIEARNPRNTSDHRPVVGLALGGGGLRGLAHIGVLQALEEAGIQPDLVVGTSAGALVGAVYASGKNSREIARLAQDLDIASFVDFTLSASGIMRGDHIADWVDAAAGGRPIEAFPIRFAAIATDLRHGDPMVLDRGRPGDAVRASAAVPGVNVPVAYRGGHLVDGGIASLVPVRAARALGAQIVIAVDIYCRGEEAGGLSAPEVMRRSMHIQSCLISDSEMDEADIRIVPDIVVPGISDKDSQQRAVEAGYAAARTILSDRELLDRLKP